MAITVRPYPDVVRAYALNFPNAADGCTFSSTVTGVYDKAFDISAATPACGITKTANTPNAGETTVEVKVVVQHTVNPDILMTSDLVLTASCVLGATSGGTEAKISDVDTIGSNLQPLTTVTTDTVNPVTMQVQYASPAGTEVSGSVALGTKLSLVIFMQNNANFQGLLVKDCKMTNNEAAGTANYAEVDLVDSNGMLETLPVRRLQLP
nr:hypothetical protein BaRGS_005476 [Batillaria attramentaria]